MKLLRFLFLGLLLSSNLFAGTRDPLVSDEKYVEYGSKFEYVGRIIGIYNDEQMFAGSAIAINPNIIITAAHVVKNSKQCNFYLENTTKYSITKIICHKDFEKDAFGQNDIALCFLEKPLDITIYPELYTTNDETGKDCSISGYGFIGTFITGPTLSDGKKRAGTNNIDYIENELLICSPSQNNKTPLEFLIASGDSGGGLFIDNKLAGINSCLMKVKGNPDGKYGTESGHTRISYHLEWILEHSKIK